MKWIYTKETKVLTLLVTRNPLKSKKYFFTFYQPDFCPNIGFTFLCKKIKYQVIEIPNQIYFLTLFTLLLFADPQSEQPQRLWGIFAVPSSS